MKIEAFGILFENQNLAFERICIEFRDKKKEVLYPISNEILGRFSSNIDLIFISMVENAKSYNLYSAYILYRSLIEHFFKAFYIFEKTMSTKSDETAENFRKHFLIAEFLAEKAGVLDMEDLQNEKSSRTDFIEYLTTNFPQFQGFDKENQKEISAATKQFGLKEMIKHFHNLTKDKGSVISQMIPEYSMVSTFTHGGMYANSLMDKYSKENSTIDELERIVEISLTAVCIAKGSFILTHKPDKDVSDAFHELENFVHKYSAQQRINLMAAFS